MNSEFGYFLSIFQALPVPIAIIRPDAGRFTIYGVNDAYLKMIGKEREEVMGEEFMNIFSSVTGPYKSLIHASLFDRVCHEKREERVEPVFFPAKSFDGLRPLADVWVEVINTPVLNKAGEVEFLIRTLKDVTDAVHCQVLLERGQRAAQLDRLLAVEREVLELNAKCDVPLSAVLTAYLTGVQDVFPDMFCSVMRVQDGVLGARVAPSIADSFLPAYLKVPIAEGSGSCGTSAHRKELVVADDIATDPIWESPRVLALAHGLKACWSYPIIDSTDQVLAVLGMYYKEKRSPTSGELDVIQRMANLLRIIFENNASAELIAQNNETMKQVEQLARFGIWRWDLTTNEVFWSDVLYDIFGLDQANRKPDLKTHQLLIVEDDRQRVEAILNKVRTSRQDAVYEERILRPDGEMRHLRTWVRLIDGDNETHPKILGACLDVTAIRSAETELKAIAWMQSHIIRAPVARIMGVIELMRQYPAHGQPIETLLDSIYQSVHELDEVIKEIATKTEQGKPN